MKKKVFSLALVICCLSVFIASSTLAYFTKEDTATNVITTGKIDIDLIEMVLNPGENEPVEVEKVDATGVMPGQEISKIVLVKNEQYASDAWVRVNITKSIVLADGTEGESSLLEIKFDTENWTAREDEDGLWHYYNKPLASEGKTEPLMETVTFSAEADNKYQEARAEIIILAQAVQVINNGASALTAKGWPTVAGEE